MKSTLQEAIGLDGDAWLRIDSRSGKIELNIDEQWQETGWRFNAITGELEVLLGSVYERSGYGYCEKAGVVTSLQDVPVSQPPSWDFQPLRQWLSSNHNWALLCGLLLVVSSFLGFHNHTGNSFPAAPIAMCILAALFATWLVWHRSSMKAALLFILAMTASRAMWLYPLLHRDTPSSAADPSLQVHSNATVSPDRSGLSIKLYQYVEDQDDVGVEEIISSGADPNFPNPNGSGRFPLHLAASSGNERITGTLLEKGSSINALDVEGETALHAAVDGDSFEVVRMLLDQGADLSIRTKLGQNALDRTIKNVGKPERDRIFELLLNTMVKKGEMVAVPGESGILGAGQKSERSGSSPNASSGEFIFKDRIDSITMEFSSESGETVWRLDGRELLKSQHRGDGAKNISPGGRSVHFGGMKLNSNCGTVVAFHVTNSGSIISYGTQSLPEKVGSTLENDSRLKGKAPIDRCWVRPVEWIDDTRLLVSAYVSASGTLGFEFSDYRCIWNLEKDEIVYDQSHKSPNAKITYNHNQPEPTVNFEGEIHPETRSKIIVESNVSNWSKEQIQFAINEMFARHGLYFKKIETRDLFTQYSWYRPDPALSMDKIEEKFSEIEKRNLKLLGDLRNKPTSDGQTLASTDKGASEITSQKNQVKPPKGGLLEEFESKSQGSDWGVTYVETPTGKGAVFNNANESRIEYSFAKGFPTQGTLEWRIYVTSGYGYSEGVFTENKPDALIFTTVGPDTWYPGCSWFTLSKDGSMTFGMADSVGGQTPVRNLVAKVTKFRFGTWHSVGISFGKEGRVINLDGQVVAEDKFLLPLGAGGTPSQVANVPTIGEMKSMFWKNNQHDSGFNGVIDTFRASPIQKDWQLCVPNITRPQ